ncbi:hypothetical protein Barb6_00029 [Bacteroidales bacterium Barb6]|nr:hypothetical protein Barb6_00029 [Bacteroidales bacterium Barb6]
MEEPECYLTAYTPNNSYLIEIIAKLLGFPLNYWDFCQTIGISARLLGFPPDYWDFR